jgi:hypothetical protein
VAWKVKDSKPFAHVILIEHTREHAWNKDELKKLYDKNHDRLKKYSGTISDTWLVNNIALKTSLKLRGMRGDALNIFKVRRVRNMKENFELSISISEEERDEYAMRPLCVDLER